MREVTGKPILFASTGEKLDEFEVFHPDRMASRILDMGDIMTLIEQAEKKFDQAEAERMAAKVTKGEDFTFTDFLSQMQQLKNMGSMKKMLTMLPGMGRLRDQIENFDEREPGAHRGHRAVDDPARARQPQGPQRFAPRAYRTRLRRHGRGCQFARQALRAGSADDARHGQGWRYAAGFSVRAVAPPVHGVECQAARSPRASRHPRRRSRASPATPPSARSRRRRHATRPQAPQAPAGSAFGLNQQPEDFDASKLESDLGKYLGR
ncbi:hypothetical protein GCM10025876_32170 [Demequina litorisediminis]|uniref:SRP54-type proteins GTP-binding domain-containing protein n=1 Tax=Demequina litorisediminis TaxID=1849022 RepID=A0ABQ6IGM7_9MICO|nr:hypothetical protein GCM10025876_32170 [Demequina litorisediminis]